MEWNEVQKTKPKDGEYVIITNGKQVIMAKYYAYSDSFVLNDKTLFVSHWMKLPSPPKTKPVRKNKE